MIVSLFGNPDLPEDALTVRLLPELQKALPRVRFVVQDPNELDLPNDDHWVIVDTVKGLKDVREISLEEIKATKARATTHDFDLAAHLLLAKKIKKDLAVTIIGVPMEYEKAKALKKVVDILKLEICKVKSS